MDSEPDWSSHPTKSDKTGVVIEVHQFDQYVMRFDGYRKFLRKYVPLHTWLPRLTLDDDLQHLTKLPPKPSPIYAPPPSAQSPAVSPSGLKPTAVVPLAPDLTTTSSPDKSTASAQVPHTPVVQPPDPPLADHSPATFASPMASLPDLPAKEPPLVLQRLLDYNKYIISFCAIRKELISLVITA